MSGTLTPDISTREAQGELGEPSGGGQEDRLLICPRPQRKPSVSMTLNTKEVEKSPAPCRVTDEGLQAKTPRPDENSLHDWPNAMHNSQAASDLAHKPVRKALYLLFLFYGTENQSTHNTELMAS